jgi:hypothetical protein
MSDPQKPNRNEMTLDERLRYLLASTESLHDQMDRLIEENRQRDARYDEMRRSMIQRDGQYDEMRRAILRGIVAYLQPEKGPAE